MIINPMHGQDSMRQSPPKPEYAEIPALYPDYRSSTALTNLDVDNHPVEYEEVVTLNPDYRSSTALTNLDVDNYPVEYEEVVTLNPDNCSSTALTNLDVDNYVTISATRSSTFVGGADGDYSLFMSEGPLQRAGGDGGYSVFISEGPLGRAPPT
jgi:hypothetical protein